MVGHYYDPLCCCSPCLLHRIELGDERIAALESELATLRPLLETVHQIAGDWMCKQTVDVMKIEQLGALVAEPGKE